MKATNKFIQLKVKKEKKPKEKKTSGFQVMQESNSSENILEEGEIVSIGALVTKEFKKGDNVLFDTTKAMKHSVKGQSYYFVNHETVFSIL